LIISQRKINKNSEYLSGILDAAQKVAFVQVAENVRTAMMQGWRMGIWLENFCWYAWAMVSVASCGSAEDMLYEER
jgi:hypothetical protein